MPARRAAATAARDGQDLRRNVRAGGVPPARARRAHGVRSGDADRLARLTSAAVCAALLAFALLLLWDGRSGLSLLGIVVAMTPMVVFVCSTVNPSGLEIAAAFTFAAALIRLGRGRRTARSAWLGLATGGALLALSRTTGPLWLVFLLVTGTAFAGPAAARAAIRRRPHAAIGALGAILAGLVLSRTWEALYGFQGTISLHPLRPSISAGVDQLDDVLAQEVGVFGYLEVELPFLVSALWWALVIAP